MKNYLIVCLIFISCLNAFAQQPQITGKLKYSNDPNMGLDTNKLAVDEQGNKLQYYQYRKLLMSGQYGIRTQGPDGFPLAEYTLNKRDGQRDLQMYEMVKKQMSIQSTLLQEGAKLIVSPFKTIDPAKFDNKAIVLMFMSPDCQPCMDGMPDLSNFLKQADPNKMILVALARGDESPERMQFLRSLFPYAYIFINYNSIYEAYWVTDLTTGYIITDKDHIIRFNARGQGGIVSAAFKSKLTEVLK